ncbi:hypothetical protein HDF26_004807 [Pedobacter cryoconitis]|uniref:outer membrane beta-barrel protein n=1 Tax=Pedobacter cryoconitis TaxID=188932 RepID=UPI00160D8BEE|nr:outer membrane beta-barrel protein [Pedobacter cryoconitis]MBB6274333.1 hypothetical protein [Pedobacter cryoconitis]
MKKNLLMTLLFSGMMGLTCLTAAGQEIDTTVVTGQKIAGNSVKARKYNLNLSFGRSEDSVKNESAPTGRFGYGITFTRLDIGFSRLIDNGSFKLSPKNDFLDYRGIKTSTVSFDIAYFGYRFNPNFRIYAAAGFDWTLIRLNRNITIQKNTPDLTYVEEPIDFNKNRFSSSYVHIPLNFEFRTKENQRGKRFYFVVGPEVSFLLNGKVKQISDERGKQKFRNDYDFQKVRLGGTLRVAYAGIGLFTKYYFNDMFDTEAQKGLKNMSFGITFGIH